MYFWNLQPRQIVILRAPLVADKYGDLQRDWTMPTSFPPIQGWLSVEGGQKENNLDRELSEGGDTLFLPPGTDIVFTDRGTVDGRLFQVLGNPIRAWGKFAEHHVEVKILFVTG